VAASIIRSGTVIRISAHSRAHKMGRNMRGGW